MKVLYDTESDTLSILLSDAKVAASDEFRDGVILDFDGTGRLVSIELLDASDKIKSPRSLEFVLGD